MNKRRHVMTLVLLVCGVALVVPVRAAAQEPLDRATVGTAAAGTAVPISLRRADIAQIVQTLPRVSRANLAPIERSAATSTARQQRRGTGRIIAGAVVGALGGLFAGGYLGGAIEGNRCHCDDPGLMGALIGAPIGAVAGGILGGRFLF